MGIPLVTPAAGGGSQPVQFQLPGTDIVGHLEVDVIPDLPANQPQRSGLVFVTDPPEQLAP